jgi:hypothetical protein
MAFQKLLCESPHNVAIMFLNSAVLHCTNSTRNEPVESQSNVNVNTSGHYVGKAFTVYLRWLFDFINASFDDFTNTSN